MQACPHVPQLEALFVRLISQPLAALLSQLAYPALQEPMPQLELTQFVVATFAPKGQTIPHPPQLLGLEFVFISQPFE